MYVDKWTYVLQWLHSNLCLVSDTNTTLLKKINRGTTLNIAFPALITSSKSTEHQWYWKKNTKIRFGYLSPDPCPHLFPSLCCSHVVSRTRQRSCFRPRYETGGSGLIFNTRAPFFPPVLEAALKTHILWSKQSNFFCRRSRWQPSALGKGLTHLAITTKCNLPTR